MNPRRAWWLGSALAFCVVAPEARPAQQPPTERPAVAEASPTQPAVPASRRAKTVLGSKVHIQGDVAIGTVDDIVFNDEGVIEYLVVLNEGKLVAVPWQAAKFNFDNRVATVNIAQERFREIPTFTVQSYPNFYEPRYRTQIYTYYGIAPRVERRVERRDRP
jgi:PRC-barrel domain